MNAIESILDSLPRAFLIRFCSKAFVLSKQRFEMEVSRCGRKDPVIRGLSNPKALDQNMRCWASGCPG